MRRRLPLIALIVVLIAELPLLIPPPFGLTDHLVFWFAGHLTATGASPYDTAAWIAAQRHYDSAHLKLFIDEGSPVWVYPAWTAFLFVPFGVVAFPAGPWTLYLAYIAIGLFSAALLIRYLPARWQRGAEIGLPLVALFQPLLIADRYGQFGSFLFLGVVLVYIGLERRRTAPLLAGAVLLFSKAQLFLVLAPVVLAVLVYRRGWRQIAIVGTALVLIAIGTTAMFPESVAQFAVGAGARGAAFAQYSTTWAVAHAIAPTFWVPLALALIGLACAATAAAIRNLPADLRVAGIVSGSALLSLVVAPVDFHYDQVPIAAVLVLMAAVGRQLSQIALTWTVAAVVPWFLFFIELGLGGADSQSVLSGIVPLLIAPAFWLATRSSSPAMMPSSPAIAKMPAKLK